MIIERTHKTTARYYGYEVIQWILDVPIEDCLVVRDGRAMRNFGIKIIEPIYPWGVVV